MTQRTVLITGTSTGIGAACVKRLAADDWTVYAGVRRVEDGERLVSESKGDVIPLILDVTVRNTIDAAVDRIREERGSLDGLVNNAGIGGGGPIELADDDTWRSVLEVNLFGLVAMTRAAFPLVDAAGGRFVHIGSIAGRVGGPGLGVYSASKHAVAGFNWSLRAELAHIGRMQSSVVEPGEIKTAIWAKAQGQVADFEQVLDATGTRQRYEWLTELMRGFVADGAENGVDADRVAEAVDHALTSKRPKARYLVGTDAKVQAVIAHLPDRGREFLLGKAQSRFSKKGRALRP